VTVVPSQTPQYGDEFLPSLAPTRPPTAASLPDRVVPWPVPRPYSPLHGESPRPSLAEEKQEPLPTEARAYRFKKRALDLALALLLLPFATLALLVLSLAVVLTSGFPIFYSQNRLGRHGATFRILKFRTMQNRAEQALAEFLSHHPEIREEWLRTHKLKSDPRITRIGGWLRSTSLDEVPQILNVLRGQMSFVGPRPIVLAEVERYGDRFRFYQSAIPGVTGMWQVSGRSNLSYNERVQIDERYAREWSLMGDVRILLRTPQAVLRRDGSC
jgi:lipopolysaccharide/colanic/teichoic acid biosynthesis glycosyltransferase